MANPIVNIKNKQIRIHEDRTCLNQAECNNTRLKSNSDLDRESTLLFSRHFQDIEDLQHFQDFQDIQDIQDIQDFQDFFQTFQTFQTFNLRHIKSRRISSC